MNSSSCSCVVINIQYTSLLRLMSGSSLPLSITDFCQQKSDGAFKIKGKAIRVHTSKAQGRVELQLIIFLTSLPDAG